MRKIFSNVVVVLLVVLVAVGCSSSPVVNIKDKTSIRIGVVQIVEHPALNSARQGFMDVLAEQVVGKTIVYDQQNAQGDLSVAQAVARKFVADKVDLILAIATPVAQAVANVTKDIPVVITAVTDPVAAGLAQSLELPRGNITGTTDMNPVGLQIELLIKLVPGVKRLGIIYNAGETNSLVQVKLARDVAERLQLQLVETTVSGTNDVMQATQSLMGKVDALYIPTDNTVVSAIQAITGVAAKAQVPVMVCNGELVENGALVALGLDYYQLGRQAGEIAIRVLNGANPGEIPIEGQTEYHLVINGAVADALGIKIPEDILQQAKIIR